MSCNFFPDSSGGHILITRPASSEELREAIELEKEGGTPGLLLWSWRERRSRDILARLEYLPLAIDLVRVYISKHRPHLVDSEEYERRKRHFMKDTPLNLFTTRANVQAPGWGCPWRHPRTWYHERSKFQLRVQITGMSLESPFQTASLKSRKEFIPNAPSFLAPSFPSLRLCHLWRIPLNYQPSRGAPSVFLFPNNSHGSLFNPNQLVQKNLPSEHSWAAYPTPSIHFLVFRSCGYQCWKQWAFQASLTVFNTITIMYFASLPGSDSCSRMTATTNTFFFTSSTSRRSSNQETLQQRKCANSTTHDKPNIVPRRPVFRAQSPDLFEMMSFETSLLKSYVATYHGSYTSRETDNTLSKSIGILHGIRRSH